MSESKTFAQVWDQVEHELGWHDHNMNRDRPYTGQPHTISGVRGATEIKGITFRDLRDAYVRAVILSHQVYAPGSIDPIQPNHAMSQEADKGVNAALCEQDLYRLKGDYDPMAVIQNLGCEIEKLMGIYPNVPELQLKDHPDV